MQPSPSSQSAARELKGAGWILKSLRPLVNSTNHSPETRWWRPLPRARFPGLSALECGPGKPPVRPSPVLNARKQPEGFRDVGRRRHVGLHGAGLCATGSCLCCEGKDDLARKQSVEPVLVKHLHGYRARVRRTPCNRSVNNIGVESVLRTARRRKPVDRAHPASAADTADITSDCPESLSVNSTSLK